MVVVVFVLPAHPHDLDALAWFWARRRRSFHILDDAVALQGIRGHLQDVLDVLYEVFFLLPIVSIPFLLVLSFPFLVVLSNLVKRTRLPTIRARADGPVCQFVCVKGFAWRRS